MFIYSTNTHTHIHKHAHTQKHMIITSIWMYTHQVYVTYINI